MNFRTVFKPIVDVSADQQTDRAKSDVYNIILNFVRKYKQHYYPHSKDDAEDLASDFYISFVTPKKHRDGQVYSEFDRYDPEATGDYKGSKLATYLQRFVISRLIDKERTNKAESNYTEKYDSDSSEASIDYLARALEQAQDHDFNPDEFEATPDLILSARDAFDSMSYEEQQAFIEEYNESKSALNKEFRKVFEDVISGAKKGSDNPVNAAINSVLGSVKINEQNTRNGSALRITLPSKDDVPEAKSKLKELNEKLEKQGYKFYTFRGTSIYYLNS